MHPLFSIPIPAEPRDGMEVGDGSSTARPAAGGDSSSCSGTLSSTYTPGASPVSSSCGFHPPGGSELDEEARAKNLGHVRGLLEEFCSHAGANADAPIERWLSEMDAAWVLHLAGHDSRQLPRLTRSWILALRDIKDSVFAYIDGLCGEDDGTCHSQPALSEFSREHIVAAAETETKLEALIQVRDALSTASEEIQFWPHSSLYYQESTRMVDDMSDLLSSQLGKLDRAIWDAVDEIRNGVMDAGRAAACLSPDIHELTRSVISCIKLLDANYVLLSRIAYEAARRGTFVPEIKNRAPLTSLIVEMFSCLEGQLVAMFQSFQHDSLGFLFLINNSHLVWQQLHPMFDLEFPMAVLNRRIDDYIQSYLQVSWGPVLSCLYYDPRPLRLGRYSPLRQFEMEFQKVYANQRLWKVPDPELRARLRKAIARKITSGYAKFLEDNRATATPRVTPGELDERLQEIFEG
ncbi:hypothetical protein PVAP13_5KG488500 [Panicum virgatum]|uniref:Exocyst subunit Exo70 family protein n=1 Tax=Panicum virgatum TaxID=38727 RepID=A0A8T0SP41_PANVG|nr:hypothetical protein PVAP13_5KG488500 [Panicum virgatum]